MEKDLTLDVILTERWSSNACRGYVIWAMENCNFKPEDIKRVACKLHWVFDTKSTEEAGEHYCQSPY